MICSHKKYYCHKKCIFELVFFETLILIEHKKSKNTSLTMITYIFFLRKDISNLQYWWSYVWNQQRINANMLCSETLNALRARLRRLTDSTPRISSQTDQMIFSAYGTCENTNTVLYIVLLMTFLKMLHFQHNLTHTTTCQTKVSAALIGECYQAITAMNYCSISYVCHVNMKKVIRI